MKLEGKKAVITGGTKGLGKALAQRFLAEGAAVAICSRNKKELEALQSADSRVLAIPCDISNSQQVQDFDGKLSPRRTSRSCEHQTSSPIFLFTWRRTTGPG